VVLDGFETSENQADQEIEKIENWSNVNNSPQQIQKSHSGRSFLKNRIN
jgi:hypothetical protein